MRKLLLLLLVLSSLLLAGCSFADDENFFSEKKEEVVAVLTGNSAKYEVGKLHREIMQPALYTYDDWIRFVLEKDLSDVQRSIRTEPYLSKLRQIIKLKNEHTKQGSIKALSLIADKFLDNAKKRLEGYLAIGDFIKEEGEGMLKNFERFEHYMQLREKLYEAKCGEEEAYWEYHNEYSKIVNNKPTYDLTYANFQILNKGDSYTKIMNILKMPGTLTHSSGKYPEKLYTYEWVDGKKLVVITFKGFKAEKLTQFGLE